MTSGGRQKYFGVRQERAGGARSTGSRLNRLQEKIPGLHQCGACICSGNPSPPRVWLQGLASSIEVTAIKNRDQPRSGLCRHLVRTDALMQSTVDLKEVSEPLSWAIVLKIGKHLKTPRITPAVLQRVRWVEITADHISARALAPGSRKYLCDAFDVLHV